MSFKKKYLPKLIQGPNHRDCPGQNFKIGYGKLFIYGTQGLSLPHAPPYPIVFSFLSKPPKKKKKEFGIYDLNLNVAIKSNMFSLLGLSAFMVF